MLDVRPLDTSPAGIEEARGLLNVVFPDAAHITPQRDAYSKTP